MNWSDVGIVLSARRHGEGSSIVSLMTPQHGRHAGLVRGGSGRRARGVYEAGNMVSVDWQARIEDHLGTFKCELLKPQAALYLDDPLRLAGLSSACAILEMALPDREPHFEVYESLFNFIENLEADDWLEAYVRWEINLLANLGFGLELTACASTGKSENLIYVSPKSGQAVSSSAGEPYKDKLLALPKFLLSEAIISANINHAEIFEGLTLTSYFMDRNLFIYTKNGAPPARVRLVDQLKQKHIITTKTS
jgi:DNA repair protein RecO (recombination protein O)